jgi:hypothetical protein
VPPANILNFKKIYAPAFDRFETGRLIPNWFRTIQRPAPPDLLKRFCAIVDTDDTEKAVVRFVRAWGMMLLCDEHTLPLGHADSCSSSECIAKHRHDSIQAYLDFALCLQTLRNIGLVLSREGSKGKSVLGEVGSEGDWEMASNILGVPPLDGTISFGFVTRTAGAVLVRFEEMMQHLMSGCRIYPALSMLDGSWNIGVATSPIHNLPAIVAIQLILEIAGAKAQRKCAAEECPRWFIPRRRQIYCDACGIRAAWRASYRRKKEKRSGMS